MYHKMQFTAEKIQKRLNLITPYIYRRRMTLPPFRYLILPDPLTAPPIAPETDTSGWTVIEPYTYWAQPDTNFCLHTTFEFPAEWSPDVPVAFYFPLGEPGAFSHPEALIYLDGQRLAATDRHHQEVMLPAHWLDGAPHVVALYGWSGNYNKQGPEARLYMRPCALVQIDPPTRHFVATARIALEVARALDDHHPDKSGLLNTLDAAFKLVETRAPLGAAFYESIPLAQLLLDDALKHENGAPLDVSIVAAGHAHIDVAWLWTLGQTRQKAARTFSTVLHLMEQYPAYKFTQSQPQLYEYIRQDHPDLFEAIKRKVAEGRWEPIGGMWVEADCNITGAESLARQFLLGRGFFRRHFGTDAESPVLWLPDVFGYSWALPQLIKKAGLDYFMTIKISWNQYNRLPYDSFLWQGIDGTRVLTHFSTTPTIEGGRASNYNATATPAEVLGTWQNFQQKELQRELLMIFGYGDGGGGPTAEMLENIALLNHFPAMPKTWHDKVVNFFRNMETDIRASGKEHQLPVWNGELYLEIHRGTYTTQSRNKRANRKSEFRLHDAEFLAALALLIDSGYRYPADELQRAWQLVCLNQFHDIIPGSSITAVYDESQAQYREVAILAQNVLESAATLIQSHMDGDLLVVNPTSFERNDLMWWAGTLPAGTGLQTPDGLDIPTQSGAGGTWLSPRRLPPYSVTGLRLVEKATPQTPSSTNGMGISPRHLENEFLYVELNDAGDIIRIQDKANRREVLPEGYIAGQFQAFEDRPLNWDAWDIDIHYTDRRWTSEPASAIEIIDAGDLRVALRITRRILNSTYVQTLALHHTSPALHFETEIDWQERHILLKVAFPVEILAPSATYEIQWGNVERPTHRNTSWDWARFESCAQKWVDLSEGDYGVSLLNDCKYGHDVHENVIRLSLLRSPTDPDPLADLGLHHFAYRLLPHAGDWRRITIPEAYAFNDPLFVIEGRRQADKTPLAQLCWVESPHVVIETVKRAEDGNGIIVRLYESQRRRGAVTLHTALPVRSAAVTNLLEEEEALLEVSGNRVLFNVMPYEILTIRLVF